MGHGVVDRLFQFLDSLHGLSQCDGDESQARLSLIRRALQERRSVIESSRDPFVEGLSTVLSVARNHDDGLVSPGHATPPINEPGTSVGAGVSQMLELMRNQIDAVAGAQIQALSRQPSINSQRQQSTLTQYENGYLSVGPCSSRPDSGRQSESGRVDPSEFPDGRSHESSQTDPSLLGMVTPPPQSPDLLPCDSRNAYRVETNEMNEDAPPVTATPAVAPEEEGPKQKFYRPLSALMADVTMVNVYVVAIEMIRASVRNLVTQRDLLNYRAVDPSIYDGSGTNTVGFSVQILAPNDSKQFHVNFGDIIRLKRVNAQIKYDRSGNRHMNIMMTLKNQPSMRIWPNRAATMDIDDTEDADESIQGSTGGKGDISAELATLASEAVVIYGGNKTRVDQEDLSIITKLRKWVKNELSAVKTIANPEFLRTIAQSGSYANDCIVRVLEVSPEPEVNLVVSDASSVAVVVGLTDIVVSNVLESRNPLQPGDWIKLRYVQRMSKPFERANGSNYIWLMASAFSCVTRLPRLNLPYKKPLDPDSPRSKRARRMTRMTMWNSASGLNASFPRHLFGSTGFVERLLEHNAEEGEIQKVPSQAPVEPEEGEIKLVS